MDFEAQQSLHIAEVRKLSTQFDAAVIEQCMQLALDNKQNPCYSTGELEQIINVLAKANFVTDLVQQGMLLSEAIRELGKRIRSIQLE